MAWLLGSARVFESHEPHVVAESCVLATKSGGLFPLLCRPPTSQLPQSSSGLAMRSRQSRASLCPAFGGVLACLATGGIDWFEDRFDAIGGDYDTATSGGAADRTKRVGNVAAPCQRERPSPVPARRCWAADKSRSFCSSKSCSSKSSNSRQMIRFSVAMPRIGSPAEARSWWRRSRHAAASANRSWKVRASFTCLYSASVAHPGLAAFQCESIACV